MLNLLCPFTLYSCLEVLIACHLAHLLEGVMEMFWIQFQLRREKEKEKSVPVTSPLSILWAQPHLSPTPALTWLQCQHGASQHLLAQPGPHPSPSVGAVSLGIGQSQLAWTIPWRCCCATPSHFLCNCLRPGHYTTSVAILLCPSLWSCGSGFSHQGHI